MHDGWHQRRLFALDLETTGTNPYTARIASVSLMANFKKRSYEINNESLETVISEYINVEGGMPPEAEKINGLSTNFLVRNGKNIVDVLYVINKLIRQNKILKIGDFYILDKVGKILYSHI